MEQNTTGTRKKSTILEQMKIMEGIVTSLDAAGVDIISLSVGRPVNCHILLHNCGDEFRQWAAENELDVIVEPHVSEQPDYGIHWRIGTSVNGIDVHGYFRDYEKEAWDRATV